MNELLATWLGRLGESADPETWLVSREPSPIAEVVRGRTADPRLGLVNLLITDGRLESANLELTDPPHLDELTAELGAGSHAWAPGGFENVLWTLDAARIVADLVNHDRVARIWVGPAFSMPD